MTRKIIYVTAGELFEVRVLPAGTPANAVEWKKLIRDDHREYHLTYHMTFINCRHLALPKLIRPDVSIVASLTDAANTVTYTPIGNS